MSEKNKLDSGTVDASESSETTAEQVEAKSDNEAVGTLKAKQRDFAEKSTQVLLSDFASLRGPSDCEISPEHFQNSGTACKPSTSSITPLNETSLRAQTAKVGKSLSLVGETSQSTGSELPQHLRSAEQIQDFDADLRSQSESTSYEKSSVSDTSSQSEHMQCPTCNLFSLRSEVSSQKCSNCGFHCNIFPILTVSGQRKSSLQDAIQHLRQEGRLTPTLDDVNPANNCRVKLCVCKLAAIFAFIFSIPLIYALFHLRDLSGDEGSSGNESSTNATDNTKDDVPFSE